MRVLIVSGIWPPEVGGPASHAPELAEHLLEHGHDVEVVTSADRPPAPERYPVGWVSRRMPRGVRHVAGALQIARRARRADVVYATGMLGRSAVGTSLARRPLVAKLTSDPSYERSLRYGLGNADFESFQRSGGLAVRALRRARDWALRRTSHVVVPSASLRELVLAWGVEPARVTLVPNPVGRPNGFPRRDELRRTLRLEGPTLVYAGRLAAQKRVDVALRAVAAADGVTLVVAGDGPEDRALRTLAADLALGERVRFIGAVTRREVFELLRAGDAAVLSSNWENFPHMAVESLAVGTPVIATGVGGVREIVRDGENGLLVSPGESDALAASIRRYFGDEALRDRLRANAPGSVARFEPHRVFGELERVLLDAAQR